MTKDSQSVANLIAALIGRVELNRGTAEKHPDRDARLAAKARMDAYLVALDMVERSR